LRLTSENAVTRYRFVRPAAGLVLGIGLLVPVTAAGAATSFHDRGTVRDNPSSSSVRVLDTGGDTALRGKTITVYVTGSTKITRDGAKATLHTLQDGDGIMADGSRDKHGRLVAKTLQATSPPKPDGPAAAVASSCVNYYGACSPELPPATGGPALTITISNYVFDPPVSVIPVGTLVTVKNSDSVAHTFSGNHLESGTLGQDQSFTVEFTTPGTYRFFCAIHAYMNGTLDVR
jgi:plastocyanin